MNSDAETRLATYGTLAPGRPNHHRLAGLRGTWSEGVVRGKLVEAGWGAELGYPGLILDLAGAEIAACVFTSPDLPDFWPVLDAFEGAGYRRVATRVQVGTAEVTASIYVIAE